jgi:hypothetical protein
MKRKLGFALLLTLVLAAPAQAGSYESETVSEVMPNGSGGRQFVELRDTAGDTFSAVTGFYGLTVFDAAGTPVGSQVLSSDKLAAKGTAPFLIANLAETSTANPDVVLTVPLPAAGGQVCFTIGGLGGTPVNCLTYRCPDSAAPGVDTSVQRAATGLAFATPTPGAENAAGTPAQCAGSPPPGGTGANPDRTKPKIKLSSSKLQKVTKLVATLKPNESGRATVSGTAKIGSKKYAIKTVKNVKVTANKTAKIKLAFSTARKRAIQKAIRSKKTVKLTLTISVKDAAGNTGKATQTIKLKN